MGLGDVDRRVLGRRGIAIASAWAAIVALAIVIGGLLTKSPLAVLFGVAALLWFGWNARHLVTRPDDR